MRPSLRGACLIASPDFCAYNCAPSPSVRSLLDGLPDLVDDGGLDALGRLVQHQDASVSVNNARAMANCCCWPPLSTPPLRFSIWS
jgi:hypothetical protein